MVEGRPIRETLQWTPLTREVDAIPQWAPLTREVA
jgi:hypothetical protein